MVALKFLLQKSQGAAADFQAYRKSPVVPISYYAGDEFPPRGTTTIESSPLCSPSIIPVENAACVRALLQTSNWRAVKPFSDRGQVFQRRHNGRAHKSQGGGSLMVNQLKQFCSKSILGGIQKVRTKLESPQDLLPSDEYSFVNGEILPVEPGTVVVRKPDYRLTIKTGSSCILMCDPNNSSATETLTKAVSRIVSRSVSPSHSPPASKNSNSSTIKLHGIQSAHLTPSILVSPRSKRDFDCCSGNNTSTLNRGMSPMNISHQSSKTIDVRGQRNKSGNRSLNEPFARNYERDNYDVRRTRSTKNKKGHHQSSTFIPPRPIMRQHERPAASTPALNLSGLTEATRKRILARTLKGEETNKKKTGTTTTTTEESIPFSRTSRRFSSKSVERQILSDDSILNKSEDALFNSKCDVDASNMGVNELKDDHLVISLLSSDGDTTTPGGKFPTLMNSPRKETTEAGDISSGKETVLVDEVIETEMTANVNEAAERQKNKPGSTSDYGLNEGMADHSSQTEDVTGMTTTNVEGGWSAEGSIVKDESIKAYTIEGREMIECITTKTAEGTDTAKGKETAERMETAEGTKTAKDNWREVDQIKSKGMTETDQMMDLGPIKEGRITQDGEIKDGLVVVLEALETKTTADEAMNGTARVEDIHAMNETAGDDDEMWMKETAGEANTGIMETADKNDDTGMMETADKKDDTGMMETADKKDDTGMMETADSGMMETADTGMRETADTGMRERDDGAIDLTATIEYEKVVSSSLNSEDEFIENAENEVLEAIGRIELRRWSEQWIREAQERSECARKRLLGLMLNDEGVLFPTGDRHNNGDRNGDNIDRVCYDLRENDDDPLGERPNCRLTQNKDGDDVVGQEGDRDTVVSENDCEDISSGSFHCSNFINVEDDDDDGRTEIEDRTEAFLRRLRKPYATSMVMIVDAAHTTNSNQTMSQLSPPAKKSILKKHKGGSSSRDGAQPSLYLGDEKIRVQTTKDQKYRGGGVPQASAVVGFVEPSDASQQWPHRMYHDHNYSVSPSYRQVRYDPDLNCYYYVDDQEDVIEAHLIQGGEMLRQPTTSAAANPMPPYVSSLETHQIYDHCHFDVRQRSAEDLFNVLYDTSNGGVHTSHPVLFPRPELLGANYVFTPTTTVSPHLCCHTASEQQPIINLLSKQSSRDGLFMYGTRRPPIRVS